jgi:transcription-repair coupling factor (superfamily II helicase)
MQLAATGLDSERAPARTRTRVPALPGSADALAIARWARQHRPLIVLTAQAADSQRLAEEARFFAPGLSILEFPDWETLPYDSFSPHQDLVSQRLATLHEATRGRYDALVMPVTTALYRLAPTDFLSAYTFFFEQGEPLDLDEFRRRLALAGYAHVSQVVAPGEFSVRGGVIDLYPMGSALPYRLDLFDDMIETIRTFDVDSQRSIYPVQRVRLLPAREFPFDDAAVSRFRQNFRDAFDGDPSKRRLYKDVSHRIAPPGIENWLPLFFEHTGTVFDYLTARASVCLHGDTAAAAQAFWTELVSRHRLLGGDPDRPLLAPERLFLTVDQLYGAIKPLPRFELAGAAAAPAAGDGAPAPPPGSRGGAPEAAPLPPLAVDRRAERPLARLAAFTASYPGRVLLLAESPGRRETMLGFLREHGLEPAPADGYADFLAKPDPLMLAVGPLHGGFSVAGSLQAPAHALITESELYAQQARTRSARGRRRSNPEHMLRDLAEVRVGDPVVHEQHGVGRYRGLASLDQGDGLSEFLALEYADGDLLYVPVTQLALIGRYTGGPAESAPLTRLGSGAWERAKRRAAQQVRDTAAELLHLYAQRAARQGHAYTLQPHDYEAFAAGFPFEETPDQAAAIEAVIEDLRSGRPMDRLVCGDVGFGKTEVALRAAFVAVNEGHQVAVLVPTTLLAEQHYHSFTDRFAGLPVRIAELSRFKSGREQSKSLAGLADGTIDIAIGTHRLIQEDVRFKRLGLVIIDEEHRFGVRQKERLKALRAEVDVLTLTATPIPRSLAMALEGLRDFSVIATAPEKRLAIKTFVQRSGDGLIREACLRELKRGGQVYFVHNDIDTIARVEERIARLVPEARVRIAHGQMRERELEYVMRDFYQQRFNVLLCTTIIETGIDVPSANTILIDRADRFGLAQLHQLRGRVGRSHHQAYAYLLLPDEGEISADARKRLDAIRMMEELGSGFFLAMHDLEIRGAGEVLGDSQSGEVQEVGFGLYSEMLNAAVRAMKAGREPPDLTAPLSVTTEINLHAPALLPETYCPGVHERLVLYKRLANCDTPESLQAMTEELVDRYGPLPEQARTLLETHRLRIAGKPLALQRIDAGVNGVQLVFGAATTIDPRRVVELVRRRPNLRMAGPDRLRIDVRLGSVEERIALLRDLLRWLAGESA